MTRIDRTASGPAGPLRLLAAAVQLLTRLRVGARLPPPDLPRATAAFPFVGALVAAAAVAARAGVEPLLGPATGTVAAVVAAVLVTGALHEDGLADACDGVFAPGDAARRLAIMRDSQLGVYGVVGLASALGGQVAVLAVLPLPAFAAATVAGHVLARGVVAPLARWVPPADDRGLGRSVAGGPGRLGWAVLAVAAVAVAAGACAAVGAVAWAPVLLGVAGVAAAGCARLLRRRVGGLNGDGYGATILVTQLAVMAAVAALYRLAA